MTSPVVFEDFWALVGKLSAQVIVEKAVCYFDIENSKEILPLF